LQSSQELYLEGFQGGAWAHPVFGRVLAIAAGSYVTIWVDAGMSVRCCVSVICRERFFLYEMRV
jgi:hypothetical protein